MCQVCGCRDLVDIARLMAEHDAALTLVTRIRASFESGDHAGMTSAARRLRVLLTGHTRVEDDALFPALEAHLPGSTRELRDEHRAIDAVLVEAASDDHRDPGSTSRLLRTLNVLVAHIRVEQDRVFPAAMVCLTPSQWRRVSELRHHIDEAPDGP